MGAIPAGLPEQRFLSRGGGHHGRRPGNRDRRRRNCPDSSRRRGGVPDGCSVLSVFDDRPSIRQGFQRALKGQFDQHMLETGGRSDGAALRAPRGRRGARVRSWTSAPFEGAKRNGGPLRATSTASSGRVRVESGPPTAFRITHFQGRVPWLRSVDRRRVVGKRIQDILETEDPTGPVLARHRAALAGQPQSFRYRFHDRCFEINLEPLSDGQGGISGCIAVAVDVTDSLGERGGRPRLQRALAGGSSARGPRRELRMEVASNRLRWSDELHRIYGLEPGQFDGTFEGFLARVHPEDLDRTKGTIFDAFREVKPFIYDHRILRSDGSARMLHTRGEVIAEHGQAQRVVGCCWDVTELRESIRSGSARSLSWKRPSTPRPMACWWSIPGDGRVTAYNKRLLGLWKLTPQDSWNIKTSAAALPGPWQLANGEECSQRVRELATKPAAESSIRCASWMAASSSATPDHSSSARRLWDGCGAIATSPIARSSTGAPSFWRTPRGSSRRSMSSLRSTPWLTWRCRSLGTVVLWICW